MSHVSYKSSFKAINAGKSPRKRNDMKQKKHEDKKDKDNTMREICE